MVPEAHRIELRIEDEGVESMIRALLAGMVVAASIFAAPTASADPMSDLWRYLPKGWGPDNCQPVGFEEGSGVTAKVSCGPSTEPGGPTGANFALFVNVQALVATINRMLDEMGPVPCPGATSPKPLKTPYGLVACGMQPDGPRIMDTDNAAPPSMLVVFGPSLEALWDWMGYDF